ncbi:MAG TPA: AhpC/TSA family protein [Acidimicrobiales bacterium]|nr:AhpC/TSA family protein [Acidimicrobiales bacterium]
MRDRLAELGDAEVALVTFTRPRNLRGYRGRFRLPFAVLSDEARASYRAYGLGRGPWWRVWGPATVAAYARLLRRGARLQRPTEDTSQLGGDFVVDRQGRLAYAFRSKGPADRPPVDDLVEAVARLPS